MTSMEPLKAMARQLLYTFLAIDQDTHSVLEESEDLWAKGSTVTPFTMTPGKSASETRISYGSSHSPPMRIKGPASKYIGQKGPLMFPTDSEKAMVSLINLSRIPSVDPQPFPLDVLINKLPFKVAACEASQHMLLGTLVEDDRTKIDVTFPMRGGIAGGKVVENALHVPRGSLDFSSLKEEYLRIRTTLTPVLQIALTS